MPTTDPRWVPKSYNALERAALGLIRDERDLIFVKVAALATLTLYPLAITLYLLPSWLTLLLAPVHLVAVYVGFGGRYMLMLHAVCHRALFKREHDWLNLWIPWVIGPLFGSTPTSFYAHHVGMHHPENNLDTDLSSTLPYKRDQFTHFLHYWARFFWFWMLHLPRYFKVRNRNKLYVSLLVGEVSWACLVAVSFYVDWAATLVVLVIPWLIIRWFMMCGNFAQHAFVDVDDANNPYRNSNCLTNTVYNHKCYNDGYHIVHHVKPTLHWSEMAQWYDDHIEEFARQDAVVFDGLRNNQKIWFLLMSGNYGVLADHLVDFKGRTRDEKIAFLKSRVQRQRGAIKGFLEREPDLRAVAS